MGTPNIFTQLAAQNAQGNAPSSASVPATVSTGTDGTNGPQGTPPTPDTHVFNATAWASHKDNQDKDVNAATAEARRQGYRVVNDPTTSNVFTQLAASNAQGTTTQQSAQQTQQPIDTVSAVPNDTFADKVKNWANNVAGDLKYGTDVTGVGHVLKALGAHGLYSGNAEGVGDFMGSLPLGLLKSTQGGAEVTQPGQRWQGTKDVAGGALQAATMPSMFVAPEGAEAASAGIGAGAAQARRAAKGATRVFDTQSIQPALQQGVRDVLNTAAQEAGITPSPAASIRDVAGQVADAVMAKSKGIYQQLDAATGGRFQRYDEALRNINQKLRETAGLDDENESALLKRKADVEQAQQTAFDDAKAAGVDPALVDKARLTYKQAQALFDLDAQLKMSTSGMRPELASPGSSPELVDPKKVFSRLNKLYDSGRLQQAVGQPQAEQLVQHADTALLHSQKIANRVQALKTAAKITGTGAAVGVLGEGAKLVKDALGSQ